MPLKFVVCIIQFCPVTDNTSLSDLRELIEYRTAQLGTSHSGCLTDSKQHASEFSRLFCVDYSRLLFL